MKTRKLLAALALGVFFSGAVVDDAMARAGRSSFGIHRSTGWRGSRTPDSGSTQGINQSRRQAGSPTAGMQPNRPSWFQRNPFMAGLAGAVAGSALFSMLSHSFGGMGGMGGGLMTLLLLAGLAMLAFRLFRSRQQPAFNGAGNRPWSPMGPSPDAGSAFSGSGGGTVADLGAYRQTREQGLAAMALESPSFSTAKTEDDLAGMFFRIQEAWSADDRATLRTLVGPDLYETFNSDLDDHARRKEHNVIKNIVIRSFETTEAWQDEDEEFITANIQARLIDYVERDGQVTEGSATEPTTFREAWTFVRPRRGEGWRLSAINQH